MARRGIQKRFRDSNRKNEIDIRTRNREQENIQDRTIKSGTKSKYLPTNMFDSESSLDVPRRKRPTSDDDDSDYDDDKNHEEDVEEEDLAADFSKKAPTLISAPEWVEKVQILIEKDDIGDYDETEFHHRKKAVRKVFEQVKNVSKTEVLIDDKDFRGNLSGLINMCVDIVDLFVELKMEIFGPKVAGVTRCLQCMLRK